MPQPPVTLNREFMRQLDELADALKEWDGKGFKKLVRAHNLIGQRHRAEAVKRVPVDTSNLVQKIFTNTDVVGKKIVTETGTNVDAGIFVEFGTKHIAGGRVKALGDKIEITDTQAIKDWPAKQADLSPPTEKVQAALTKRAKRGGPQEQMPWLRPSWMAIRKWAVKLINDALRPPKQKRRR